MRQVILIHAHRDIAQLNALVAQLLDDEFLIYVNVDAKSAIDVSALHPAARLVHPRIAIHWGRFSQVEATLHSMRQVLAEAGDFDKLVFISAQDAPLLPNRMLKRELAALGGRELLDCVPVGPGGWNCAHRYQYFHVSGPLAALANRAMRACRMRRRMVHGWQPWAGSSWWALSRGCVEAIVARVAADPALARFFRSVDCPDEMFFQTVVMNSPFGQRVLHYHFRHIQWTPGSSRSPKVLGAADFGAIAASPAHFCRKLEPAASAALLPLLAGLRASREP
ncbi:MAG: beta-1,6-N-acetylglucosaminyltransferase [Pseudomonadota bacterium]